ncbi:hypothetical protein ACJX0J_013719 [Zea mays]
MDASFIYSFKYMNHRAKIRFSGGTTNRIDGLLGGQIGRSRIDVVFLLGSLYSIKILASLSGFINKKGYISIHMYIMLASLFTMLWLNGLWNSYMLVLNIVFVLLFFVICHINIYLGNNLYRRFGVHFDAYTNKIYLR